jgi:hypothetical protein
MILRRQSAKRRKWRSFIPFSIPQMRFSVPLINVQIKFYQRPTKARQLNATDRLRLSIFTSKTATASGGWLSSR